MDSDGDQSFDATEEVFGEWQGQLNDNISSANILLKNYPPYFEVSGLEKFVRTGVRPYHWQSQLMIIQTKAGMTYLLVQGIPRER